VNTLSIRPTRHHSERVAVVPPNYTALCTLHNVQIVLDDRPILAALAVLGDALAPLGERQTLIVLGLPEEEQDETICQALTATLPFADTYILYTQCDEETQARRVAPYLVCDDIPPERICVFATTARDALRRAWQRVRPGDHLVLIGKVADEALELLPLCPEVMGGEVATLRAMLSHSVRQGQNL
jgi:hypothetical protein